MLPAAGFVAIRADQGGFPGEILGVSELLQMGTITDLEISLEQPVSESGLYWVTAFIDRDADGLLLISDESDDRSALTEDGLEAAAGAEVIVVPRSPARASAEDQEGDGTTVTVFGTLPAPGPLSRRTGCW